MSAPTDSQDAKGYGHPREFELLSVVCAGCIVACIGTLLVWGGLIMDITTTAPTFNFLFIIGWPIALAGFLVGIVSSRMMATKHDPQPDTSP